MSLIAALTQSPEELFKKFSDSWVSKIKITPASNSWEGEETFVFESGKVYIASKAHPEKFILQFSSPAWQTIPLINGIAALACGGALISLSSYLAVRVILQTATPVVYCTVRIAEIALGAAAIHFSKRTQKLLLFTFDGTEKLVLRVKEVMEIRQALLTSNPINLVQTDASLYFTPEERKLWGSPEAKTPQLECK
jgi:hypothetical protein